MHSGDVRQIVWQLQSYGKCSQYTLDIKLDGSTAKSGKEETEPQLSSLQPFTFLSKPTADGYC